MRQAKAAHLLFPCFRPLGSVRHRDEDDEFLSVSQGPFAKSNEYGIRLGAAGFFARPARAIHRQLDRKGRAFSKLAFGDDRPAVSLNDSMDDRKAQSRSFADRLGGKERI